MPVPWFTDHAGGDGGVVDGSTGCAAIAWVEIAASSAEQDAAILALLREIHLPGRRIEGGFRIYGHIED